MEIIVIALVLLVAVLVLLLLKRQQQLPAPDYSQPILMMQQHVDALRTDVQNNLQHIAQQMNQSENFSMISEITGGF